MDHLFIIGQRVVCIYVREIENEIFTRFAVFAISDPSINVASNVSNKHAKNGNVAPLPIPEGLFDDEDEEEEEEEMSGHDAPEWGTVKSFVILFACTVLYSIIAEILVDEVDVIMKDIALDEKFLGLTLFALVSRKIQ